MKKGLLLTVFLLLGVSAAAHPGVGIVMDSRGNVYYTDLKQVWKISPDGKKTIAVPRVHTHELYMDENDNLFGEHLWYEGDATRKWGHRVWRLAPDGTVTMRARGLKERSVTQVTVGESHVLMGVWDDSRKNVYVAVYGARMVKKVAPDGAVSVAARTPFPWSPTGGMVAPNGDLWLLECSPTNAVQVRRIAPDGRTETY